MEKLATSRFSAGAVSGGCDTGSVSAGLSGVCGVEDDVLFGEITAPGGASALTDFERDTNTHLTLANNLLRSGQAEAAFPHYEAAARIYEPLRGRESILLVALTQMARQHDLSGESEQALAVYTRGLDVIEGRPPFEAPVRKQFLQAAAQAYDESGNIDGKNRIRGLTNKIRDAHD